MWVRHFLLAIEFVALGLLGSAVAAMGENKLVLPAERELSFVTDEGTWLSLDVSSSSDEIVFELLGDLYVLSPSGGIAKPISVGTAFDSQPVFSPEGSRVAFISDRSGNENIWVANSDGSKPRQVTNIARGGSLSSPSWSADGQYIYVSKAQVQAGPQRIWAYHIAGGSGFLLKSDVQNKNTKEMGAYATADGLYLYFTRSVQSVVSSNLLGQWNVVRQNLHTGKREQILVAAGGSMRPVVSPDGQYLAYITRLKNKSELRVRDLHKMEDRRLAYPLTRDLQESFVVDRDVYPSYAFTNDSKNIIINSDGKIKRIAVASGTTDNIPFTAQVNLELAQALNTALTEDIGPVRARVIQAPRLSPNGKQLTFSALGKIYVMSLPNGKPIRLTTTPLKHDGLTENFPSWSPDGKWITYTSWQSKAGVEQGHIWKVKSSGGKPVQLTKTSAFYRTPAFTPDGKFVVALRGSNYDRSQVYKENRGNKLTRQDLIRVGAKGRSLKVLGGVSNSSAYPYDFLAVDMGRIHFDKAGHAAYVYTSRGLLKTPLAGGSTSKLLQITWQKEASWRVIQAPVEDLALSPDGNWLLATADSQLYLIGMPPSGGNAVEVDINNPSTPVKRLTDIGADFFAWEEGGKTISWTIGSTYYRLPLADVQFDPVVKTSSDETKGEQPFLEAAADRLDIAVELPRDIPSRTAVLRGATAITMQGDAIIENADIVVRDNRIVAIGSRGDVYIPPEVEVHDLSGQFVTPGFTDTHAHWGGARRGVLDMNAWVFSANLAYGVTSGLDVQAFTNDVLIYQDLIDAGVIPGPRAYNVARGVFSSNKFRSKRHALGVLKRYKNHYRTDNVKAYAVGNRLQRQYVASAAADLGLVVTTEGGSDTKMDLTHALDGFSGNEHGIPVTLLYKDTIKLYADSGIGYTPTLLVTYGGPGGIEQFYAHKNPLDDRKLNRFIPHRFIADRASRRPISVHESEHVYPKMAEGAVRIFRAGGKVGIGGHGELQGLGYHWEMQLMAAGGATPHEILQMATLSSASIIGRQKELGSLEVGKFADLIVLSKNPLDDIRNALAIEYVMKNGRLYRGDDLTEVRAE